MFNIQLISRGIHMLTAIKQFFAMFTVLFAAGEKLAKTADNFATWAEESSGAFSDQARIERKQKLALITNQQPAQLTAE